MRGEARPGLPGRVLSMEGLGFTEITSLYLLLLILEYGHGRLHAQEAELSIEGLFARNGVQEDFLVAARGLDKMSHNLLTKPTALVTWHYSDITDVRAIGSVCECSSGTN